MIDKKDVLVLFTGFILCIIVTNYVFSGGVGGNETN